eukprot:jgi/Chlat1/2274/Chrsp17S02577
MTRNAPDNVKALACLVQQRKTWACGQVVAEWQEEDAEEDDEVKEKDGGEILCQGAAGGSNGAGVQLAMAAAAAALVSSSSAGAAGSDAAGAFPDVGMFDHFDMGEDDVVGGASITALSSLLGVEQDGGQGGQDGTSGLENVWGAAVGAEELLLEQKPIVPRCCLGTPPFLQDWTVDEQRILEEGLQRYPADKMSNVMRYVRIAAMLPEKSVRDVALRARWMSRKDNGKRRKPLEESVVAKKPRDKKVQPAPHIVAKPLPPVPALLPVETPSPLEACDGSETGRLLEMNTAVANTIKQNLVHCKVEENGALLARMRDNILAIMNGLTSMPGITSMPPLPIKMDLELANTYLPPSLPTMTSTS